ncbi:MAG TPA: M20 family peptidase, partial [Candidatus Atribacteria bacterium]|nr:M20 family peptidase [Candidatus Atribacteria bacterium]
MSDLKSEALNWIEKLRDEILGISKFLYENPELGSEEFKACELLTSILEKHDFSVERGFMNMKTAFKASFKGRKNKPKIAFLAEYDALPEIGHGCGHNIIAATTVGAAIAISKVLPSIDGEVIVIGTPAEEGHGPYGGSKVVMAEKGAFKDIDVVLTMHPLSGGRAGCRQGALAVQSFKIVFRGKTAHASAAPHLGINALNAVMLMFHGIDCLRQHVRKDARIHGIIVKGGEAANVIPDYAEAAITIRAADLKYLNELKEKVFNCAKGAALMTGAKVEIEPIMPLYREKIIYETLAEILEENLKEEGLKLVDPIELIKIGPLASTDFGNVTQVVPAISAGIPIMEKRISLHTRE